MDPSPALLDPRAANAAAQRHVEAWIAFHRRMAFHPSEARALLEESGGPEAALRRLPPELPGTGLPAPASERHALARAGVRGVALGSPGYPERLAVLPDAPPLLWVRGRPELLARPCAAIVGTRAPTVAGRAFARRLAADLARSGIVVVSGLAAGIDAEAHRGALEGGGSTIAVLGCGPDRVYPPRHAALARAIAAQGALVSEFPLGTPPLPHHFPLRNRLISGLSRAVTVIEARARSGSLITARHAADQGREVLAMPGPVEAPTSVGPNLLLRDGVRPVLDVTDVLRAMGTVAESLPSANPRRDPDHPVLRALRREPLTRDELARRLGRSAPELARDLVLLELEGRVAEDRDGRLRVVSDSPTP